MHPISTLRATRPARPVADAELAQRSLRVLGLWHAVVDPAAGRVRWASEGLARRYPDWSAGTPLDALANRFPGLGRLLEHPDGRSPHEGVIGDPDGHALGVTACRDEDGLVHLRLEDQAERQQANVRHLADREQLLFISRSMSVGEMATTLAHELNQPIGAITNLLRGLLNRMEREALEPQAAMAALRRGIDQAMYASGIIARIREFVQQRQPRQEPIALAGLLDDALALLDWEIRRDRVRVRTEMPTSSPRVIGDPVMLQQVVVNLVRNAVDAMRGVDPATRVLTLAARVEGGTVTLDVTDRGAGISDEAAGRVFTTFFTTKPGGMGVGLHICRSIIELHRGRLWFTRNPGAGCTFHIALPVAPATPGENP
jgi:C4-dicarboxylate-specific signal transduction histidine kinase